MQANLHSAHVNLTQCTCQPHIVHLNLTQCTSTSHSAHQPHVSTLLQVCGRVWSPFPLSATVPCNENAVDTQSRRQMHFINSYDHPASLSHHIWCHFLSWTRPSNHCHNEWCNFIGRFTSVLSGFLQVVQAEKQTLHWQQQRQRTGFQVWHHLFPIHCTSLF